MHGMGLLATRSLHNEEIVYDYRLDHGIDGYPSWYTPVEYPSDSFFGSSSATSPDSEDGKEDNAK